MKELIDTDRLARCECGAPGEWRTKYAEVEHPEEQVVRVYCDEHAPPEAKAMWADYMAVLNG